MRKILKVKCHLISLYLSFYGMDTLHHLQEKASPYALKVI
jgi:hypothetical protein